jgi:uncharacterized repeat protein (TIGR01451 family)
MSNTSKIAGPARQALRGLCIGVTLAVSWAAFAAELPAASVAHFEQLQDMSFSRDNAMSSQLSISSHDAVLTFSALGRTYELQLQPNDRLLSGTVRDVSREDLDLYRGKIAGNEDSWVRIVMHRGEPRGLIWDGAELLAIEAPGDSYVATTVPVIFRLEDALILPGAMSCDLSDSSGDGATVYQALLGELGAAAARAATLRLDISAIGDFRFVESIGGNPVVAIATRLNSVDGIFSDQVGVHLMLQETEVFTTAGSEPFTDTTNSTTLNFELGNYREGNVIHRSHGLTHLFTGRELDGSRVGTGYMSLVCWDHFGVGLTQATHGATMDSLIAAHEIGHNLGAPHDAVSGSPCESEPATFLMAPTLSGSSQFSACSLAQMQPVIDAADCIVPLSGMDVSITPANTLPTLLLGDDATVTFDVRNVGSAPMSNVVVDVTLPNNVTFVSAAASAGTCASGASTANCQLGTVATAAAATVTISTTTSALGIGSFDAVVTADADDNPGNDQASVQVSVTPAIDLIVSAPPTISLSVGQAGSVNVSVENAATIDATGVNLTVTLDNGIRPDSASWSVGSCNIAGQQIDCQAARVAAGSGTTLSLGLAAVAAGSQDYSVQLTAAETDRDTSNNNVNGTVTVTANSPGGSGGGGGSVGWLFLFVLPWALSFRTARARPTHLPS